jgi:hypothetical protein
VDCCQVLLVHLGHVLHAPLLHVLRYDGRVAHPQPPGRRHCGVRVLLRLQPLLRIRHLQAGTAQYPNSQLISYLIMYFSPLELENVWDVV